MNGESQSTECIIDDLLRSAYKVDPNTILDGVIDNNAGITTELKKSGHFARFFESKIRFTRCNALDYFPLYRLMKSLNFLCALLLHAGANAPFPVVLPN